MYIDDVTIVDPDSYIVITNVTTVPMRPVVDDTVDISATITPELGAHSITATVYYTTNNGASFSPVTMSTTGSNYYVTDGAGIPAQSTPHLRVDYYIEADFQGSQPGTTTDRYPGDAPTTTLHYVVSPASSFTNMNIKGAATTNMLLTGNYEWQGVIVPGAPLSSPVFHFSSDTNTWGDANQSVSNLPVYGTAETGETNINVSGQVTNPLAFWINDNATNLEYSIQNCVHVDFDAWTGASDFGTYTNGDDWVISGAEISDTGQTDRGREGRGQYVILKYDQAEPQYVRSPEKSAGVGVVSLWYRHRDTSSQPTWTGAFQVKTSTGPTTNGWVTVPDGGVTEIITRSYRYFSVTVADPDARYVWIVNDNSAGNSWLCIDDVIVTDPGGAVVLSNPQRDPETPDDLVPVNVSIDAAASGGATNLDCSVYVKATGDADFSPISMTRTANTFYATIPAKPAGDVDYYFKCLYDGFGAAPSLYPAGAPGAVLTYTLPESYVDIAAPEIDPEQPVTDEAVAVSTTIEPFAGASISSAKVHYSTNNGETFSTVDMSTTGSYHYVTVGDGIPAQSTPYLGVDYYIEAEFTGSEPGTHTTTYPTNAPDAMERYVVIPRSSFTNMSVMGSATTNMLLAEDYQWQGVIVPGTPLSSPVFHFASGTNTWGDANQSISNLPAYGTAEAGETSINVSEQVTNALAFLFNDDPSNLQYFVENCAYVDFDSWASAYDYGTYTNGDGWVISGAQISDAGELDRGHEGRGQYVMMKHDRPEPQYVRSPNRADGAGAVSFWYRHRDSSANPSWIGAFVVKTSTGPTTNGWMTVEDGGVTGIITREYRRVSVNIGDPNARYVWIVNDNSGYNSWLCIDDVIVTDPGATVVLSNPQRDPSDPSGLQSVSVTIDAAPDGGATNLAALVYARPEGAADFNSISMTRTGNTFYATIPAMPEGEIEYYFKCAYEGLNAKPAYYPPGAPGSLLVYTNGPFTDPGRHQDFSTWSTGQTNGEGWVINDGSALVSASVSVGRLEPLELLGDPYLVSPLLSNGAGRVTLRCANAQVGVNVFQIETSTNLAGPWSIHGTFTNTTRYNVFTWFTNDVNVYGDVYLRVHKTDDELTVNQYLYIDDVEITLPPADAAVSDIESSPPYAKQGEPLTVSCVVTSLYSTPQAFGFSPVLHYFQGESWQEAAMTSVGSNRYSVTIYPQRAYSLNYYVECEFLGYYHSEEFNQSPVLSPLDAPGQTYSIEVRKYSSDYNYLQVTSEVGTAVMSLINDHEWQGVFDFTTTPTNLVNMSFQGIGHYTLEGGVSSNIQSFGDSQQSVSGLPQASMGQVSGNSLVLSGNLNGQVVFRYDTTDNRYMIARCGFQDFNTWQAHPDFFEESLGHGDISFTNYTFDTWPLSMTYLPTEVTGDIGDFETMATNSVYGDYTDSFGWVIKNARGIEEFNENNAVRLNHAEDEGYARPGQNNVTYIDGVGTHYFRYRCTMEDDYITWYDGKDLDGVDSTNWLNYAVEANISVIDVSPMWPYVSMFARMQGTNVYYEYRLEKVRYQTDNPIEKLQVSIWKHVGAAATRIAYSKKYDASIIGTHRCRLIVHNNNNGHVYLEAWRNGERWVYGYSEGDVYGGPSYDTSPGTLSGPGKIGFYAKDATVWVNHVNVFEADVQRFEYWTDSSWGPHNENGWAVENGKLHNNEYCILSNNWSTLQNFDDWSTDPTWTTRTHEGWNINDAMVSSTNTAKSNPNAVWLCNDDGAYTNSYVRSPSIGNGLHALNFWCCNRIPDSTTHYAVQISTNGTDWSTTNTATCTTHNWEEKTIWLDIEGGSRYVRIKKTVGTSGGKWFGIDSVTTVPFSNRRILSPRIDYDVGRLEFRYRRDDGGSSDVRLGVYGSTNGTDWTRFGLLADQPDSFTEKSYTIADDPNLPNYRYFRIDNSSFKRGARIDNIYITEAWSTDSPDEGFDSNPTNWPRTGHAWRWDGGFGRYGRKAYVGPEVSFIVQTKATNALPIDSDLNWVTYDSFTVSNLHYVEDSVVIEDWQTRYTRIKHTGGEASLVVDDLLSSSWRATREFGTNGWSGHDIWVDDDGSDRHVELWRNRTSPTSDIQYVESKFMDTGVEFVAFNYKIENGPTTLEVRQSNAAPLTNFYSTVLSTNLPTTSGWEYMSVALNNTNAIYVRVYHAGDADTDTNAILYIDDLQLRDYKPRDTATWLAYNALITYKDDAREFEPGPTLRTCYLNNDTEDDVFNPPSHVLDKYDPYVQSALLQGGVGEISFFYSRYADPGSSDASIRIYAHENETDPLVSWTALGTIDNITAETYQYFKTNLYEPHLHYVRFYGSTNSGADRLCLDNVLITEPLRSDFIITNLATLPEVPLYTDNVGIQVELTGFVYEPTGFQVRAYYNIGSNDWGNWETNEFLELNLVTSDVYRAIFALSNGIPKQNVDEVVQYYPAVLWDGMLSESHEWTNAKTYKHAPNPPWYEPVDLNEGQAYTNPYYFVFSCGTGDVWINEFNILDYPGSFPLVYTNQYIELAGKTGANITNWWIEVFNNSVVTKGAYRVTNNVILDNEDTGYGFWLLASNGVPGADQRLTNQLPDSGGIRLRRGMGAIQHAVCYNYPDTNGVPALLAAGFEYVGYDEPFAEYPVMLVGTGTVRADFEWIYDQPGHSANARNDGQTLLDYTTTQTLEVVSSRGGAVPPVGVHEYNTGDHITCRVTNSPLHVGINATQYMCTGWVPTGNVPLPGGNPTNTGSFIIQTDSSITWTWGTNVYLDIVMDGNGSVDNSGWLKQGTNVTVTATPDIYNAFTHWTGDTNGMAVSSNQLTFTLNVPRGPITAHFVSTDKTLDVASLYERCAPLPGLHTNHFDAEITCVATSPAVYGTTQYVCTAWSASGSVPPVPAIGAPVSFDWTCNTGVETWNGQNGNGWVTAIYADGNQQGIGNRLLDPIATNGLSTGDDRLLTNGTASYFSGMVFWNTPVSVTADQGLSVYSVVFNSTVLSNATHYIIPTNDSTFATVDGSAYDCGTALSGEWMPLVSPATNQTTISTGPFNITNESTIAWNWETNYYLTADATGSGTIDRASQWLPAATSITITASADPGHLLLNWSGDTNGCTINGDEIQVPMDRARHVTAQFSTTFQYTDRGTPYAWLALYFSDNYDYHDTNDYDMDFLLTWMEYVAGTDPTNPLSVFRLLEIADYEGSNMVSWYATTNSGVTDPFSMYRCEDLMGDWVMIVTDSIPRSATGTNVWWDTEPPTPGPVFYYPMVNWTNGL